MKLALAMLLCAAPLVAQTPDTQKIVVNVVVTLVQADGTPIPTPTPSPIVSPSPTPVPITPAPTSTPSPTSTSCVTFYTDAAKDLATVSDALTQAQQVLTAAHAANTISDAAYASGTNAISSIRLDNGDVRDLMRIGGAGSMVSQNVSNLSSEVATLPGLLGTTSQLQTSITSLVTGMQSSLSEASYLAGATTCPASLP